MKQNSNKVQVCFTPIKTGNEFCTSRIKMTSIQSKKLTELQKTRKVFIILYHYSVDFTLQISSSVKVTINQHRDGYSDML